MNSIQTSGRASTLSEAANIILGIWVAVSPFILGFQNFVGRWSNVAVGIALALVTLAAKRFDKALQSLALVLAIWLFVSPFLLGFSTTAFVANNVTVAFVVVTAAAMSEGLRRRNNL